MLPELIFNIVTIKGNSEDLKRIKSLLQGFDPSVLNSFQLNDFCINNLLPLPRNACLTGSQIQLEEFRRLTWKIGTNAEGTQKFEERGTLKYYFMTDLPIYPAINALEALNTDLSVEYKFKPASPL